MFIKNQPVWYAATESSLAAAYREIWISSFGNEIRRKTIPLFALHCLFLF